jgi:RNA polymerase sigma-70 factor (ECF subfamily)
VATDVELLEAWRAGESTAGEKLFERYFAGIARFFRNKLGEPAEDLIQRTFLACVEGRDRLREDASFRSYLFAVAHNILRKHFEAKRLSGERLDFGATSVQDIAPGASTIMAKNQQQRLLLEALRRIPLDYQVALELTYWERMTAAEVAESVEIPEGTAKTRIRRGRQLVEEQLATLATSAELLQTTISDLEGWARSLRDDIVKDPPPE